MKTHLKSLTSLRFLAALSVFIFHCQIHLGAITNLSFVNNVILNGACGMSLFFILSGFILSHVYQDFNSFNSIRSYLFKRFARIYPTYFLYGLLSIPMVLLVQNQTSIISTNEIVFYYDLIKFFLALIAFIFLVQAWFPTLFSYWNFGGSWSLSVEAFFYLLFPVLRKVTTLLNLRRLQKLAAVCWVISCLPYFYHLFFTSVEFPGYMGTYIYCTPIFRLADFLLGIVAYRIFIENNYQLPLRLIVWVAGFVLYTAMQILPPDHKLWHYLAFNAINIPYCCCLIVLFSRKNTGLLAKSPFVWLGKISYSFYLAQFFVFGILKGYLVNFGLHKSILWLIAFVITLAIATLFFYTVEERFRYVLLRRSLRKGDTGFLPAV